MEEQKNNGFGFVILEMIAVAIIVLVCLGLMYGGKQEPKPTQLPTQTAIPTQIPTIPTHCQTSTPSPTPTPMPTFTPTPTPTPIPSERKEVGQGHTFKPYTRHFVYDVKGTAQCKLQSVAYTDERTGIRVVDDTLGNPRYCVALGTYWCGGHPEHIGRCVDVYMANGSVLKCVLADVKRTEDTINAGNRYGAVNHDVLEFIVDGDKLPKNINLITGGNGNMSRAGKEFEGDAVYMIVYDMWIDGFGKDWNK